MRRTEREAHWPYWALACLSPAGLHPPSAPLPACPSHATQARLMTGRPLLPLLATTLLLLLLLLLLFLPSDGASSPLLVRLAAILPSSGSRTIEGDRARNVLHLLLGDINGGVPVGGMAANLLGGARIELVHGDSQGSPLEGMRALQQIHSVYNESLYGVFGCIADDVTLALDTLASELGLMTVSPLATTVSLGNLVDHPFFWRTSLNDESLAKILIMVSRQTHVRTRKTQEACARMQRITLTLVACAGVLPLLFVS